ncbi:MAG: hypothetical protein ACPG30_03650 [Parvibaculales bacterium]
MFACFNLRHRLVYLVPVFILLAGVVLLLAQAAAVKNFAIFHHDPRRSDAALLDIDRAARALFANAFAARDFQTVEI